MLVVTVVLAYFLVGIVLVILVGDQDVDQLLEWTVLAPDPGAWFLLELMLVMVWPYLVARRIRRFISSS